LVRRRDARGSHGLRDLRAHRRPWLHRNGAPAGRTRLLQDAILAMPWPDGERVFAWTGCESESVRSLRSYLRGGRGLGARQHLAIGYWRHGMDETSYHDAHNNDRDADYYKMMQEHGEALRAKSP